MGKGRRRLLAGLFAALAVAAFPGAAGASPPVRIGAVPAGTVKDLIESHQPLLDHLAARVGRPFELRPAKSQDEVLRWISAGQVDGAVLGSAAGLRAIREAGALPIARPDRGGVSTYRSLVVVRKDSGYRSIGDLKGQNFDFASRGTASGDIFPSALVARKGHDPARYFARVFVSGRHETAIMRVLNMDTDGAAVKDRAFERLARQDPRVASELEAIHRSEPFPENTFLLRKEAGALADPLRRVLLGLHADAAGQAALRALGADRFVPAARKDFSYLEQLLKTTEGK